MLTNYNGERRMTVGDLMILSDPDIEIRVENIFGKILAEHNATDTIEKDDRICSTLVEGVTVDGDTLVIVSSDKCPEATIIK